MFPAGRQPVMAFVKVTLTMDGNNCEVVGRSTESEEPGRFVKQVMTNVLELISIPRGK
jgi:hypothetical protein